MNFDHSKPYFPKAGIWSCVFFILGSVHPGLSNETRNNPAFSHQDAFIRSVWSWDDLDSSGFNVDQLRLNTTLEEKIEHPFDSPSMNCLSFTCPDSMALTYYLNEIMILNALLSSANHEKNRTEHNRVLLAEAYFQVAVIYGNWVGAHDFSEPTNVSPENRLYENIYSYSADTLEGNSPNLKKSIYNYEKARSLYESLGYAREIAFCHMGIGFCHFRLGNYQNSIESLQTCSATFKPDYGKANLILVELLFTENYARIGNHQKALLHAKKAYAQSKTLNDPYLLLRSADWLRQHFYQIQNYRQAYEYAQVVHKMRDKILIEQNLKHKSRMEAAFELEQKERENRLLEQARIEQDLNINKSEYQFRLSLIIDLLLLLAVIIVIWLISSSRKARERLLKFTTQLYFNKNRFYTNVSHEIRAPLTLLSGPLKDLMADEKLSAKNKKLVASAIRYCDQLSVLNTEILELAGLKTGMFGIQRQRVIIHSEVSRITSAFISVCESNKIKYFESVELPRALQVEIDIKKFEKILNNLIGNAIKYTKKEGEVSVHIAMSADQKSLRIIVMDNGRGISERERNKIFDRYYRSHQDHSIETGGFGVGLSIVQEMVKLMGGSVEINSTDGQGSRFVVMLPVQVAVDTTDLESELVSEPESSSPNAENIESVNRPLLMIVEDHEDMLRYIIRILNPHFRCIGFQRSIEAWEFLQQGSHQIELIISDGILPDLDGFELLKRIKLEPQLSDIPVILLTARVALEDKVKAFLNGVDNYMTKPFEADELLVRVKNLLSNTGRNKQPSIERKMETEEEKDITADQIFLSRIENILRREVSNSSFSLVDLADEMKVSQRTIHRRVKKVTGFNTVNYFRELRLKEAHKLLVNGHYRSVAEVSFAVGFESPGYFGKVYTERFGKNPSLYLYEVG